MITSEFQWNIFTMEGRTWGWQHKTSGNYYTIGSMSQRGEDQTKQGIGHGKGE